MEEKIMKVSLFQKAMSFINNFPTKENKKIDIETYSTFKEHLKDLDKKSEIYEYVNSATELCDQAIRISKKRFSMIKKIAETTKKMSEIECFYKLDEDQTKIFKELLNKFIHVGKEKSDLQFQLTGYDSGLGYLEELKSEATFAVGQIKEAENKQRILRHDIGFIEGEKSDLEYEKDMIERGLIFMHRFSTFMVFVFICATFSLGYAYLTKIIDIFIPGAILSFLILAFITFTYIFRRRAKFEILVNLKKQHRAIELLNKKNVVYVYYTNFLKFEYKKYKVRNSKMLKNNLHDYENYKFVSKRYDVIRKIMYQVESELESFLRHNNINSANFSIEKFVQTINLDDKKKYYTELQDQRQVLEDNIKELDKKHEDIWDLLIMLNDNDKSQEKIVDNLIHSYFDELSKLSEVA